jgi:hypothetical protein
LGRSLDRAETVKSIMCTHGSDLTAVAVIGLRVAALLVDEPRQQLQFDIGRKGKRRQHTHALGPPSLVGKAWPVRRAEDGPLRADWSGSTW